jgi:hypothetical protein
MQDRRLTFEEKRRIAGASLEVETFSDLPADLKRRIIELEATPPGIET